MLYSVLRLPHPVFLACPSVYPSQPSDAPKSALTRPSPVDGALTGGDHTLQACFDAHRIVLLALLSCAASHSALPGGGAAVLMRVVHPSPAPEPSAPMSADRILDHLAVLAFDPRELLAAPRPLHGTLMRWAPIPQAHEPLRGWPARAELDQLSTVHLGWASGGVEEPLLVLSVNAEGRCILHRYVQAQWRRCEPWASIGEVLHRAHVQTWGYPVPDNPEALAALLCGLRERAQAGQAAAHGGGASATDDAPHSPSPPCSLPGVCGQTCATPKAIEKGFPSVLVAAALRERVRYQERCTGRLGSGA